MIEHQLNLINKPDDPPTLTSLSCQTTSSPDLAKATDNIHKITSREVCRQLGGSDHRSVILHVQTEKNQGINNLRPSWNIKKANWPLFTQNLKYAMDKFELPTNLHLSAKTFSKIIYDTALITIPRGKRKGFSLYWTEELETLHKNISQARNKRDRQPNIVNTIAHNKAKAVYYKKKNELQRQSWHQKTEQLNLEKDTTKLWKLTKSLNDDHYIHNNQHCNTAKRKTCLR